MNDFSGTHFLMRLKQVVERYSERPAIIVDGAVALTYRELWSEVSRVAAALRQLGVEPDSTVALCLPKSAESIVAKLAVWKCRAAWVPIEPSFPKKRIEFIAVDSGAAIFVAKESFLRNFDFQLKTVSYASLVSVNVQVAKPDFENSLDDLAYLIYTSGSSGKPKGVEVAHGWLVELLEQQIAAIGLTSQSRSLYLLSPSFDASISDIGTALLSGAALVIEHSLVRKGRLAASSVEILKTIAALQISYVDLPPSLLSQMDPKDCPTCLKTILIGGEVCPAAVVRSWAAQVRLINVYGPTEATICTSLSVCGSSWDEPKIGSPLSGVEYRIEGDQSCGELWIAGPCLARGYRNNAELTKERFVFFEEEENLVRYYKTGDLVRVNEEGDLIFEGRVDRQIKKHGHRIEPSAIESVIVQNPNVKRAAVQYRKSGRLKKKLLVAYFSCCDSSPAKIAAENFIDQLRQAIAAQLPLYMMPQQFIQIEMFPETITGKIDFRALESIVLEDKFEGDVEDKPEQLGMSADVWAIESIFRKVLGHNNFSAVDHFLNLGGDSLSVTEVCAIAQSRGLNVTPFDVVEHGSPIAIADCLNIKTSGSKHVKSQNAMEAEELRSDVVGILKNCPASKMTKADAQPPNLNGGVFLTGATGFLGIRILECLLKLGKSNVSCLVRGVNQRDSESRLEQALATNQIELDSGEMSRIRIYSGDMEDARLGLNDEAYQSLARSVDQVIHCAADTNTLANYRILRKCNVIGTQNVANFALSANVKSLEFISSLIVLVGTDRFRGAMLELDDLSSTTRVYGGYAQSKWAAELLLRVRNANENEFKGKIRFYRPGLLTPDLRTGVHSKSDLLTLTLRGLSKLGCCPEFGEELKLDATPVDYAANAIVKLTQTGSSENTFHIAHPNGLSANRLFDAVSRLNPGFDKVSNEIFQQRVESVDRDLDLSVAIMALSRQLLPEFQGPDPFDLFRATDVRFDMTNTKTKLQSQFDTIELTNQFVDRLVAAILKPRLVERL